MIKIKNKNNSKPRLQLEYTYLQVLGLNTVPHACYISELQNDNPSPQIDS